MSHSSSNANIAHWMKTEGVKSTIEELCGCSLLTCMVKLSETSCYISRTQEGAVEYDSKRCLRGTFSMPLILKHLVCLPRDSLR